MYRIFVITIALCVSVVAHAQVTENDSLRTELTEENDTLIDEPIELPELVISKNKLDENALKAYLLLQKRVYKVYPYAKIAADRLTALNKNTSRLQSNREKRRYFKLVENYLENEFTDKLKKLSRKQGQILVKLICRQTGITTYDLVKDYKSGWKAFWANKTARVFSINLKTGYSPFEVNEDYLIETILVRAFENGQLVPQVAANPVNYEALHSYWVDRVERNKANSKK